MSSCQLRLQLPALGADCHVASLLAMTNLVACTAPKAPLCKGGCQAKPDWGIVCRQVQFGTISGGCLLRKPGRRGRRPLQTHPQTTFVGVGLKVNWPKAKRGQPGLPGRPACRQLQILPALLTMLSLRGPTARGNLLAVGCCKSQMVQNPASQRLPRVLRTLAMTNLVVCTAPKAPVCKGSCHGGD